MWGTVWCPYRYFWDTLYSASLGICGAHYAVPIDIFGTRYVVFLLVFWDILYSVSVGVCGAQYILFLFVFLEHTI